MGMRSSTVLGFLLAAGLGLAGGRLFALTDPARVIAGKCRGETVSLQGVISAAAVDSYDNGNLYLVLQTPAGPVCLAAHTTLFPSNSARSLIDAEVEVRGHADQFEPWRNDALAFVGIGGAESGIDVLRPAASAPFEEQDFRMAPSLHRQRVVGTVHYASARRLILYDRLRRRFIVLLAPENAAAPQPGQTVVSAGFIGHGPFGICQTEALTSVSNTPPVALPEPRAVAADELFVPELRPHLTPDEHFNGARIRIAGTLVRTGDDRTAPGHLALDCGITRLTIDASDLAPSALDGIADGSRVEVSGICLFEFAPGESRTPTPQFRGITLIPFDVAAVRLLARPPWWTPARLIAVIGVMVALLVAILLWNVSLRVLVNRRSHELARRRAEAARARLKTAERTRLASELHDSVVQNLTGAALEIRAARSALPPGADAAGERMDIALKTVNSSRAELRNCIWDLRNQALEQRDVDEAIRITLRPHLGESRLALRFNVARTLIPDTTFHAILCICRELVVNALRHGGASTIRIAGAIDGRRILFSVTDDGCGFDPESRPGMEEGHFGLEGVLERARALDGSVRIDSRAGRGTRVSLNLALSRET